MILFIYTKYQSLFKCNLDVTRFVFQVKFFIIVFIFPVLAESRAGGGAGAPHGWLTVTYTPIYTPGTILQAVEVGDITASVHGAAPVLPLSEAVVTRVW